MAKNTFVFRHSIDSIIKGKFMNVPRLRFKEFSEEWEVKKIGEISDKIIAGGTPSTLKKEYWQGDIRWMNSGELNLKRVYEVENRITKLGLNKSSTKLIPRRCILIGLAGQGKTRGTVAMNMVELCTNQSIASIYPKPEIFNEEFLYHNLDFRYEELRGLSTGDGGRGGLNLQIIKSINIQLPTLPEQTKIANFLTAVDKKIAQLTQKGELLGRYKKGVMQLIFSQQLRFKDDDGREFPEWVAKKLGDIAEVKRGAASQHLKYVNDESKGIRLLRINDFLSNDAVYVEDTDDIKRFQVKTNDLLIAGTGATAGIVFIVPKEFNNMSFSYNAPRIRVTNAHHTFIYYYLKSGIILKQQQRLFVGNAQQFLDTDSMRGFKVNVPSLSEQTKIANFLTAIDDKISHNQTQLNALKQYKQGLLQQMFV
jgi:type I restriction enzyme S subunit